MFNFAKKKEWILQNYWNYKKKETLRKICVAKTTQIMKKEISCKNFEIYADILRECN